MVLLSEDPLSELFKRLEGHEEFAEVNEERIFHSKLQKTLRWDAPTD